MAKLVAAGLASLGEGRHTDGDGLYLQVVAREGREAARSWLLRYTSPATHRVREMGLGRFPDITLKDARLAAGEMRRLVRQGVDPVARRQVEAEARAAAQHTFEAAANAYVAAHKAGWRNPKHIWQWSTTLADLAFPLIGAMRCADITTADVLRVLHQPYKARDGRKGPLWETLAETSTRLRGRVEAVLDYASGQGWRSGPNPAAWTGNLKALLPPRAKLAAVRHQPAMPYGDVPGFMAQLERVPGAAALALRFAILTAARTGEVRGAVWGEIDTQAATWTVPPCRMKAGVEHVVPITPQALAVLEAAHARRDGDGPEALVFPGGRRGVGLSDMSLLMVMRRLGYGKAVPEGVERRGDAVPHGFRSAFRDWAGDKTAHPREVAEGCLAHAVGDKVEAAYRRSSAIEKRRALLTAWANYVSPAATEEPAEALSECLEVWSTAVGDVDGQAQAA